MACYVDPLFVMESRDPQAFRVGARNGHRWCHLFADTPAELHALAVQVGMRREWFQGDRDGGHYDLTPGRRAAAVALGAREVTAREAVAIWQAGRKRAAAKGLKMRVFWAEAKGTDPVETRESIMEFLEAAKARAKAKGQPEPQLVMVPAGEEFQRAFPTTGWRGWAGHVAEHFGAVALPGRNMGRGTFDVAKAALDAGKSVLLWEDGAILKVRSVRKFTEDRSEQDWQSYGEAITG